MSSRTERIATECISWRWNGNLGDDMIWAAQEAMFPAEVRLAEVRPAEVRPAEVRPAEVRPAEVRPAKVCLAEVRLGEVRLAEVPHLA